MRRLQLIELHELPGCPTILRDGLTDFLETAIGRFDLYGPVRPMLLDAVQRSGTRHVVDLCSGAGGPWVAWQASRAANVEISLTDKFPNSTARARIEQQALPGLHYVAESVDAAQVQPSLAGFRTVFTAFHHFPPEQARHILADAIAQRQPIGIFEYTNRRPAAFLFMLLSPLAVWLLTPRMRTLSWSKLLFTYLIPLIPLLVTFDGVISCWRTYRPTELEAMTEGSGYIWLSGTRKGKNWPIPVTYFIGYPAREPVSALSNLSNADAGNRFGDTGAAEDAKRALARG